MNRQLKKYGLVILAFLICVCLNYNPQVYFETSYQHWGWNFSLLAAISIVLLFRYRNPADWKSRLGINFNKNDYLGFLIAFILLLILSYFAVYYVSALSNYNFRPKIIYFNKICCPTPAFPSVLADYIYYIPETFNEEILIGALLLMGIERNFKRAGKNLIAISIALIFSLMHQALFKWGSDHSGILTPETLMTLFFVGILRNALILKTRKIAWSWAIHLSFNLVFFQGFFIHRETDHFATVPERFNIVFGNLPMLLITGLLAVISLIWLNYRRFKINKHEATGYNITYKE